MTSIADSPERAEGEDVEALGLAGVGANEGPVDELRRLLDTLEDHYHTPVSTVRPRTARLPSLTVILDSSADCLIHSRITTTCLTYDNCETPSATPRIDDGH